VKRRRTKNSLSAEAEFYPPFDGSWLSTPAFMMSWPHNPIATIVPGLNTC